MGREEQKTSNVVRTASFWMCRYMYCGYIDIDLSISIYHCGEKRGYHGLKRLQKKNENKREEKKN